MYFKTDENSIFDVHNPIHIKIKILKRLRLNFSHLNEHKFCHNFRSTVNPLCFCNSKTETTSHNLLGSPLFSEQRTKFFESLFDLDNTFLNHFDDDLLNIFLYGSSKYSFSTNNKKLSLTVEFLATNHSFNNVYFHVHMTSFQRR